MNQTGRSGVLGSSGTPGWVVQHRLPGRVRLHVPSLLGNPGAARQLQEHLLNQPGITHAEASARTGSLLVLFQEHDAAGSRRGGSRAIETRVTSQSRPTTRSRRATRNGQRSRQSAQGQPAEGKANDGLAQLARGFRKLASMTDQGLKSMSGGRIDLKQVVLGFLLVRPGFLAAQSGVASWSTIESVIEFLVAWTLYQNPQAEQEAKQAKDIASPSP